MTLQGIRRGDPVEAEEMVVDQTFKTLKASLVEYWRILTSIQTEAKP